MARRDQKAKKGRIARGQARGLPRTQALEHVTGRTRQTKPHTATDDLRIEAAILDMNRGRSLTAAARAAHISRRRLRKFLTHRRLGRRKGRRWVTTDTRPRRVPVMTEGRFRVLTVRGYDQAQLVGEHHQAVGEFVRTNDVAAIEPFEGRAVQAVNGRRYVLETDPNTLHRIAAMDAPAFHEIYEITSNT